MPNTYRLLHVEDSPDDAELLRFELDKAPSSFSITRVENEADYAAQLESASRSIAEQLDHSRWSVAYQSRSGSPRDPWLEPDIGAAIRDLARGGAADVVVAPIGFVCDHVEVLYDLDVEAKWIAAEHGVTLYRAPAVNAHPEFIAMLAELVREAS